MKKFFRGLLLLLASVTFAGLLFFTATLITFWTVLANPTVIKSWLASSGVYASVIDEIAKQTKVEQTGSNQGSVLESDQLMSVAKTSFTPQAVQKDAEQVIDGIYAWLQGVTPNPEFSIDLTAQKSALTSGIATELVDKIKLLPACTGSQNSVTQADLTSLDCLPKNLDLNAAQTKFVDEFNSTSNFLPDNKLDGTFLKINTSDGKTKLVGDALPWVPKVYRALLWAPWVSLGLLVLSVIGLIILSTKKRKGCFRVARGFMFSGALLVIVGVTLVPATEKLNLFAGKVASNSLTENIINPLLAQVWKHTARVNLIIGGGYVITSLILYIILFFARERRVDLPSQEHQTTTSPQPLVTQNSSSQVAQAQPLQYQQPAQPNIFTGAPPQVQQPSTAGTTPQYHHLPTTTQPQPQSVRVGGYAPPTAARPLGTENAQPKRPPMIQG